MKFLVLNFLIIFTLISCGKKEVIPPTPSKPELKFPDNNSACLTGSIVSDTESSLDFTWNIAANATGYDLIVKNLITNKVETYPTNNRQNSIKLLRNAPYSWYVIAKTSNNNIKTQSDTWKFYNSGPSETSHAPFPTELISPKLGENIATSSVNLTWKGIDVDNDISIYDIYLGTSNYPIIYQSNVKDLYLNNITVNKGSTYYWKVIAKDTKGNSSESQLYQFTVTN